MFYCIAHLIVSFLAKLCFRLKVIGLVNVPKQGGVIVAANHNSYFDIPLLGCALHRPADNIAKSELFQIRFLALFFRVLGGFPIRREKVDREAMNEAVRRIKQGRLLAYYPEGTRSKDGRLQKGKAGIGKVVVESEASVVPAFIKGTGPVRLFRRVTIRFGKQIDFSQLIAEAKEVEMHPKTLYGTISTRIMAEISRLEKEQEDAIDPIHF